MPYAVEVTLYDPNEKQPNGLSERQERVLGAIFQYPSYSEASRQSGVPLWTIYSWINTDATFQNALKLWENLEVREAVTKFKKGINSTIDGLLEQQNSDDERIALQARLGFLAHAKDYVQFYDVLKDVYDIKIEQQRQRQRALETKH